MYKPTTKLELEAEARALGMIAIFPEAKELQIDLDEGMSLNKYALEILEDNDWTVLAELNTISKGGNKHLILFMETPDGQSISNLQRAAIQASLGSDPTRELLAALYEYEGPHYIFCLFESKENAAKVEELRQKTHPKKEVF